MVKYEFNTIDVYTKGDLKGYANGSITFEYHNDKYNHEFLYRINDASNGENNKLVSIDYGYKIPNLEKIWSSIENELFFKVNYRRGSIK